MSDITDEFKIRVCDAIEAFLDEHGDVDAEAIVHAEPRDPRSQFVALMCKEEGINVAGFVFEVQRIANLPAEKRGEPGRRLMVVVDRLKAVL